MAVHRGLLTACELAELTEADKKLIRSHAVAALGDKNIARQLMSPRSFEALIGSLDPKVKRKLAAKIRPLKKRLLHKEELPAEAQNVVGFRRGTRA